LVGRIHIVKLVGQENALFLGDFTIRLGDGKITAAGAAKFTEFERTEPIFAVTGGTGPYRDAGGEVVLEEGVRMCETRGVLTTIDIGPQP
jgi:hypothetical protein